jgi:D-alanyl-D-alanine carboxypeptidase/D-alanyl-D-alanine-endopeptidase (penicillin-binding protein 4)
LKAASYKISNSTDYSNATQMMIQFMKNYGINTDGLNIADGSGLSRTNLVTTEQLCRLLMLVKKDKRFDVFYESLPIAGVNGTVKNFLKNKDEGTTYRIKSGFMFKVRAYAGFVTNNKGEMICFAFIVNNFNCSPAEIRLKMEKLLKLLPQLLQ